MVGDECSIGVFFGKLRIGLGDELDNFGGISLDELGGSGGGAIHVITTT